jgi:ubiquinone/menaquinone biosynthesis C-methylase UbiE
VSPLSAAPRPEIRDRSQLPYLVEHWYLGPSARHYMMVRRFREVLEHARLEPGQRVLDLGCGWAYGTLWAAESGARASGIDLEMDQLRWARGALDPQRRLALAQANAAALPFRAGVFDRVVSVEMMEHVFRPDRPRVLAEIARVTRPGGRLSLSTPNAVSPIEIVKRVAVRWKWLRRALPSACFPEASDDQSHYHPYRYHHPLGLAELARGLEEVGFEVEGARSFLWVMKTVPDALLPAGRAAEALAETLPLVRNFGATSLIWAVRR